MKDRAFAEAAQALAAGEIVGIFPEGKLTDTGELNPFRPGVQQMLAATPVPVVPMALSGLWGSFFSRSPTGGRCAGCAGIFSRIALVVGPPVPPERGRPDGLQAMRARAARRAPLNAPRRPQGRRRWRRIDRVARRCARRPRCVGEWGARWAGSPDSSPARARAAASARRAHGCRQAAPRGAAGRGAATAYAQGRCSSPRRDARARVGPRDRGAARAGRGRVAPTPRRRVARRVRCVRCRRIERAGPHSPADVGRVAATPAPGGERTRRRSRSPRRTRRRRSRPRRSRPPERVTQRLRGTRQPAAAPDADTQSLRRTRQRRSRPPKRTRPDHCRRRSPPSAIRHARAGAATKGSRQRRSTAAAAPRHRSPIRYGRGSPGATRSRGSASSCCSSASRSCCAISPSTSRCPSKPRLAAVARGRRRADRARPAARRRAPRVRAVAARRRRGHPVPDDVRRVPALCGAAGPRWRSRCSSPSRR